MTKNGSNVERNTACGTWKSQSNADIHFHYPDKNQQEHIGSIRKLSYVPNQGFQAKGRWIMHEYRLNGILLRKTKKNDYVLCRVIREEETTTPNTKKAIPEFRANGGVEHRNNNNMVKTSQPGTRASSALNTCETPQQSESDSFAEELENFLMG
ncbi:NAM domain-containing protein [Cephalotus follicularis]|uniref:NAM domain-containing protein n=1 Tax=Cephalotus follicularis TaxID=3775 RepID=A0A1Q3D8G1_CEPFO|nr:NAM domain-containing protein [Cephalotus follicularis]